MTIEIEVGKTYRSRDGSKVKIVGHEPDHQLPFIGNDQCGYRPDGGYLPLFGDQTPESEMHEFDLVSEEA